MQSKVSIKSALPTFAFLVVYTRFGLATVVPLLYSFSKTRFNVDWCEATLKAVFNQKLFFKPSCFGFKMIIIRRRIPLFILDSIYSTSASAASEFLKQIIQTELNRVKNPNRSEANQLAIYKHDRGFKLGLPRTDPASGESGT